MDLEAGGRWTWWIRWNLGCFAQLLCLRFRWSRVVFMGDTHTTQEQTTVRTNQYEATCIKCREDVPAETGILYKNWPYDQQQRWLVRCGDEDTCAARVAGGQERARAEHLARHYTSERYLEAVAVAARYPNLPKKIVVRLPNKDSGDHGVLTLTRRKTKTGYNVRAVYTYRGETLGDQKESFLTEDEAIAHTVDDLRDRAKPYFPAITPPSQDAIDILNQYRAAKVA